MLFLWAVESRQKELSLCVACGSCGDKAVAARGYLQYRCFGEGSPWHLWWDRGICYCFLTGLFWSGDFLSKAPVDKTVPCVVLPLAFQPSPAIPSAFQSPTPLSK